MDKNRNSGNDEKMNGKRIKQSEANSLNKYYVLNHRSIIVFFSSSLSFYYFLHCFYIDDAPSRRKYDGLEEYEND